MRNPEASRPIVETHEDIDISRLSGIDRRQLEEYLDAIDTIDTAYKAYRASGAEFTRAKKSGDQSALSEAMQRGNATEAQWQQAKTDAKALASGLPESLRNFAFGDKNERAALRQKLESTPGIEDEPSAIEPRESSEPTVDEETLALEAQIKERFHEELESTADQIAAIEHSHVVQNVTVGSAAIQEILQYSQEPGAHRRYEAANEANGDLVVTRNALESFIHDRLRPLVIQSAELPKVERNGRMQELQSEMDGIFQYAQATKEKIDLFAGDALRWRQRLADDFGSYDDELNEHLVGLTENAQAFNDEVARLKFLWDDIVEQAQALPDDRGAAMTATTETVPEATPAEQQPSTATTEQPETAQDEHEKEKPTILPRKKPAPRAPFIPKYGANAHPEARTTTERWNAIPETVRNSREFRQAIQDTAFDMIVASKGAYLPDGVLPVRAASGYLIDEHGVETNWLPSQVVPPSEITELNQRTMENFNKKRAA